MIFSDRNLQDQNDKGRRGVSLLSLRTLYYVWFLTRFTEAREITRIYHTEAIPYNTHTVSPTTSSFFWFFLKHSIRFLGNSIKSILSPSSSSSSSSFQFPSLSKSLDFLFPLSTRIYLSHFISTSSLAFLFLFFFPIITFLFFFYLFPHFRSAIIRCRFATTHQLPVQELQS